MARGWESKSVEAQQDANDVRRTHTGRAPGADERARQRDRVRSLELTRSRIVQQIETTPASPRRAALESALADVDGAIAAVTDAG